MEFHIFIFFSEGPWQPCWISDQRQKQKFVYDHLMNISAKFGSNLFCGFRKKDENVKFPKGSMLN
jgi:hypothetical protein